MASLVEAPPSPNAGNAGASPAGGRILVAVDRQCSPALPVAANLARAGHGRLTVLACLKDASSLASYHPTAWALLNSPEESEGLLHRILRELPRDIPVTGHLRRTSVLRALLEEAREHSYDTLVIGDRDQRLRAHDWRSRKLLRCGWPGEVVVVPGC